MRIIELHQYIIKLIVKSSGIYHPRKSYHYDNFIMLDSEKMSAGYKIITIWDTISEILDETDV